MLFFKRYDWLELYAVAVTLLCIIILVGSFLVYIRIVDMKTEIRSLKGQLDLARTERLLSIEDIKHNHEDITDLRKDLCEALTTGRCPKE